MNKEICALITKLNEFLLKTLKFLMKTENNWNIFGEKKIIKNGNNF